MIERDMACAVCAYTLNAIDDNGTFTFEHPVAPRDGNHAPVPVPAYEVPEVYRRCHLCSVDEPVWMYETPEIEAVAVGGRFPVTQTYSTQWHACLPCSRLIEQGNYLALTRRSIAAIGWHPAESSAQILAGVHRTIVATRLPSRTLLTTGAWRPAPLKAASLPKVRDRLAGLLRGPVGLPAPLDQVELRRLLADGLDQARLYWIDPQFTALVAQVLTDLPDTAITERIVPASSGLLAWSTPVDHRHLVTAASWTPQPDGWQVACYRSLGLDLPSADTEAVRHEIGWLVPVHVAHLRRGTPVNGHDSLAALAASWLIIAQQLAHEEPAPVAAAADRNQHPRTARRGPPDAVARRGRRTGGEPAPHRRQEGASRAAAPASRAGRVRPYRPDLTGQPAAARPAWNRSSRALPSPRIGRACSIKRSSSAARSRLGPWYVVAAS